MISLLIGDLALVSKLSRQVRWLGSQVGVVVISRGRGVRLGSQVGVVVIATT